jgi:cell division protein FtsQ
MSPTEADISRKVTSRATRAREPTAVRPSTAPPVDPRIRERRSAVTRREGRRRLRILLFLLVAVLAVVGGWLLLHSRLLSARVVTVIGSVHTPAAEIVSLAGLSHDPPMIDVDPGAAESRLEQLPWVSTAIVSRRWPDGVRITVVERSPVAVVSTSPTTTASTSGRPWALVDRSGRILADVSSPPTGMVHLVTSVAPGPPGTDLGAGARPGLEVAASLPRAFSAQVTSVDVGGGDQVSLRMTTPVTIVLGDTTQLTKKYEDAASVLAGARLVAGDVIDVSVPESPTVTEG